MIILLALLTLLLLGVIFFSPRLPSTKIKHLAVLVIQTVMVLATVYVLIRLGAPIIAALGGGGAVLAAIIKFFIGHIATKKNLQEKSVSLEEARAILGVDESATADEIQHAYLRLIKHNHPDRGGTEYLAATINQARETLLNALSQNRPPE